MSGRTITAHVELPAPEPFKLNGTPLEAGCQLGRQLLHEPMRRTLAAMPAEAHYDVCAGVLTEAVTVAIMHLGKAEVAHLLDTLQRATLQLPLHLEQALKSKLQKAEH